MLSFSLTSDVYEVVELAESVVLTCPATDRSDDATGNVGVARDGDKSRGPRNIPQETAGDHNRKHGAGHMIVITYLMKQLLKRRDHMAVMLVAQGVNLILHATFPSDFQSRFRTENLRGKWNGIF